MQKSSKTSFYKLFCSLCSLFSQDQENTSKVKSQRIKTSNWSLTMKLLNEIKMKKKTLNLKNKGYIYFKI